ncbi:Alpha/Beta hydrolase protein [Amylocystis lapponica]|nr:Alpha/Beta hydrolase protein [Amylocystis lapponica]
MVWPLSLIVGDTSKPVVQPVVEPSASEDSPSPASDATTTSSPSSPMDFLSHFESPDVLPPSARVGDPKLKQRESQPLRPWQLWKFGAFAAVKATGIVSDVVSHQIWGPRRKSWGIEMTLLSSIMRDVGRHSQLADVVTIRMLMSIGGYAPLPADALVTPVTFHVHKRKLRGILAAFDAAEDGARELSAEWVVGKKTQRIVLYIHGGAYYCFSAATHRLITIPLAKYLDARLFYPLPGPLHDAVSAYFRLIKDLHIPPENIVVAGDSAGGGLCLALLMYLRDNKYPLPSGAILFSPWVDLTMSCDSWDSNAQYDIVPAPQPGDHLNPIACYLGEDMEKYLTHPYASPLFGDFKGLPPLLIQAGDAEVLRDEITLLAHKATLAGVEVRHELYEDAVHVFQSLPFLDAAQHAYMACRDFVRHVLPQHPHALEGPAERELAHEIDNDARVVRGDGTEVRRAPGDTSKAADGTAQQPAASQADDTSDTSDTGNPSWGVRWPTPPSSEDDAPAPAPDRPAYARFQSALSLIADAVSPHVPVPQPAVRRADASHPDITVLCRQWADSGPANATRTVRLDRALRARSGTGSSASLEGL